MNKIRKIWNDPVWSKVISAGIIFVIAALWAKFVNVSIIDIYNKSIDFLNFRFPIYYFLLIVLLLFFIKFIAKKFKKKQNPYLLEKIGNYTFGELMTILMNKKPRGRTVSMEWGKENTPDKDFLTLFYNYYSYFNRGVKLDDNYDDRGFIYGILCPELVGFELLDKIVTKNERLNIDEIHYQVSENGKKFHSLIEKSNMFE